ncbi:MAG TPA: phosphotransferase [Anaerolineae bacterium]|nr:phosphotransferase [Anaerolineae bacterium]
MTIACPVDPRLPGLAAALDADHVAALLAARLRAQGNNGICVADVHPVYIRYKPLTNAVILHRALLRDATGSSVEQPVALTLYPGDHATAIAGRRRSRELCARLPRGGWPLTGAWSEPSLGALAQGFPFDRGLPGLATVIDPRLLAAVIDHGRPGDPPPRGLAITLLRYKPGRRAVLRAAAADGRRWYVKVGAELRPALLECLARGLTELGIRTPAIVAACPDEDIVVQAGLDGTSLMALPASRRSDSPDGVDRAAAPSADQVCALLRRVQRLEPAVVPGLAARDPIAVLARAVAALDPLLPARAADLARLAAGIEKAWRRLPPSPMVLVHGDFYEDQILVDDHKGIALLDWDEAGLGPAALDAACWLAHAQAAALEGEPAPVAAEAIRAAWLAARPEDAQRLDLLAAIQLLALAPGPFRRLEPTWPQAVEQRWRQVEAHMSHMSDAEAVTSGSPRRLPSQTTPFLEG